MIQQSNNKRGSAEQLPTSAREGARLTSNAPVSFNCSCAVRLSDGTVPKLPPVLFQLLHTEYCTTPSRDLPCRLHHTSIADSDMLARDFELLHVAKIRDLMR